MHSILPPDWIPPKFLHVLRVCMYVFRHHTTPPNFNSTFGTKLAHSFSLSSHPPPFCQNCLSELPKINFLIISLPHAGSAPREKAGSSSTLSTVASFTARSMPSLRRRQPQLKIAPACPGERVRCDNAYYTMHADRLLEYMYHIWALSLKKMMYCIFHAPN